MRIVFFPTDQCSRCARFVLKFNCLLFVAIQLICKCSFVLIDFSLSLLTLSAAHPQTDKDGKVSVNEYIGDMFVGVEEGEEEPEWVKNERETFASFRDKDHDGYMNNDEVRDWIIPPDFDHSEAEARHLIYEADTDADSKLTKDEILDKYDLFVGSQATDFGEALTRHDEF